MKYILLILAGIHLLVLLSCTQTKEYKEEIGNTDTLINVKNKDISLTIDPRGGMFISFVLHENPCNPFGWEAKFTQMPKNNLPFVFQGHFLCTGRWGAPSEGEINAGIPHNGEVNTQIWQLDTIYKYGNLSHIKMHCNAPKEKLDVKREITLPSSGNYFIVKELFKNNLPVGKQSNFVQHGTIAAPFLSEKIIINTNAARGFDQRTKYSQIEDSSYVWPKGKLMGGHEIDLQKVNHNLNFVTTHIFNDAVGWVTALNPDKNLLLGYIWKTKEYPWLNLWYQNSSGKPYVHGLEFGTTGLGKPYKLLLENNVTFFGRHSFEFIDAGKTKGKSWICFQIEVPENIKNIESLTLNKDEIVLAPEKHNEITINGNFESMLN